jgi:hydrogenase maturation protease
MGPGDAIALGRALGRLPERLVIYGIEGEAFGEGETITPPVVAAIDVVVERVERDVSAAGGDDGQATS